MSEQLFDGKKFRSYSYGEIDHTTNHHRRNSSNYSIDVFKLIIPTNKDLKLSHLICSICSLPMMKPTILPCQHTFCFNCIQNSQQTRSNSLPTHSNSCLLSNTNQTITIKCQKCSCLHNINSLSDLEENQSIKLLINTLLCEHCHQLYSSNQLDTCSHCFSIICFKCFEEHAQNHRNSLIKTKSHGPVVFTDETVNIKFIKNVKQQERISNTEKFQIETCNTEEKSELSSSKTKIIIEENQDENTDSSQMNSKKKKLNNLLRKMRSPSRHNRTLNSSNKDLFTKISPLSVNKKLISKKINPRENLTIDTNIETKSSKLETIQITTPVTPVRKFLNLHDRYTITDQHIKQSKQRQLELDRTVKKLIDVLTRKSNENIKQITQYWIYFKQTLLEKYQTKTNRYIIFNYLLQTCCSQSDSQKQIDLYIEQNDEIKAALEVLSTIIMAVIEKESISTITHLFDREQQTTIRQLKDELETLLSSYSDGLILINECINVYESRFTGWKEPNTNDLDILTEKWTEIVKVDYPSLIEKISNDFITNVPQIEKTLLKMLSNMQKRLLNMNHTIDSRRTSLC